MSVGAPRILVVEDDPDALELFATALSGRGYAVRKATSAEEAAAVLAAESFDLLVTDWDLPGKSGAVLAAEQAAAGRLDGTAVMVVTAHPEPSGVDELPVVPKPVELGPFFEQVERLLAGRSASPAEPSAPRVELVLYATEGSTPSARARRNLDAVLSGFDAASYTLTVRDPAREPLQAEADRVVFAPTLVKLQPEPRTWFLGDLSNAAALHDLLALAGAAER